MPQGVLVYLSLVASIIAMLAVTFFITFKRLHD